MVVARKAVTIYGLLVLGWLLLATWQAFEHVRFKDAADRALRNRARDISNTLGVVIRSQRFFITQAQLERVLEDLVAAEEVISVALLNAAGEVVAAGGEPLGMDVEELPRSGTAWQGDRLTVVNLIDLGESPPAGGESRPAAVVVSMPEPPPPPPDGERREGRGDREDRGDREGEYRPPRPPGWPWPGGDLDDATGSERFDARGEISDATGPVRSATRQRSGSSAQTRRGNEVESATSAARRPRGGGRDPSGSGIESGTGDGRFFRRTPSRWHRFDRPFWMSEAEYRTLLEKQGLSGFILVLSGERFRASVMQDLWLRFGLAALALVAALGLGLAWRNLEQSARLQMRLVRASEMNARLREMNIAAAGLAHETRNPLNLVRGISQLIAASSDASPAIRAQARDIAEEVDRAAARLNEFIEYSRPPEARPAPTALCALIREVDRTLASDKEAKGVEVALPEGELTVEADEGLLRQVVFNLLLNAVQEAPRDGRIEVVVRETGANRAAFEVRDNGPGVPEELRDVIFRPYYTTHEEGTGLGLAVVRQILLAHGWEIEYIPRDGGGAIFRVSGLAIPPGTA